mgnify:FL=1
MKKITNRLLCALILLCAFGVFVGCQQEPETKPGPSINSPSINSPSIVGTWMCNEDISGPNKLVFYDSGAAIFYVYGEVWLNGTYSVTGNSAKIYASGYDEEGNWLEYVFNANFGNTSLTLSIGPNSATYVKV